MNGSFARPAIRALVAIFVFALIGVRDPKAESTPTLLPNETGKVMVLMYHGIGAKDGAWVRSRRSFRNDLATLYGRGYRPIALTDFVQNRIAIEKGLTPVVLTFDDGRLDNFKVVGEGGEPVVDPESAVGILEAFHRANPDFSLEATFFLNGKNPFRQPEWLGYKLDYLISRGMDVGNHTVNHANLALDEFGDHLKIQRAIGKQALFLEKKITEHTGYRVTTYALCHGGRPKGAGLSKYLRHGTADGYEYSNIAVLNVGSGPAPSPVDREFNPMSIPRIRASDKAGRQGMNAWIEYFDNHPGERYVSDGDPQTVTAPRRLSEKIDSSKLNGAVVTLYDPQ